jgi:hypothetical protein
MRYDIEGFVMENSYQSILTVPGGRYLVGRAATFSANALSMYLQVCVHLGNW